MLYYLSDLLSSWWGPLRLFRSHALLLAAGTFMAAFVTAFALPRLARLLPRDRGKAICRDVGGGLSAGKPTGAGMIVSLVALPMIAIFVPLAFWDLMCVLALYGAMVAGYLDDRAERPWGEGRKLALDVVVSVVITVFADHSFTFVTKTPPAAVLIKKACGIKKASGVPNKTKVAQITKEQIRKIAETKMPDLNAADIDAAMSMVAGTARSMGVTVVD